MDNFIFCKTCHTASDLENDYCENCGCDLSDNVYYDSSHNTNLKKIITYERKTGDTFKASFKLNDSDETLYTTTYGTSAKSLLPLIILIPTVVVVLTIVLNSYVKLNDTYSVIILALVIGSIAFVFYYTASVTFLVQTPNQATIGKIIQTNLIKQQKWTYIDVSTNEQFQLTFLSREKGLLQLYDQSYSMLIQRKNRNICTVTNANGDPILKAINEAHRPFPRSVTIYFNEKFDELGVIFVISSLIERQFTKSRKGGQDF